MVASQSIYLTNASKDLQQGMTSQHSNGGFGADSGPCASFVEGHGDGLARQCSQQRCRNRSRFDCSFVTLGIAY